MKRMQTRHALAALAALAQASRLAVFRHLVQAGPGGGYPGDIAQALGSPSTLSFHLKALAQAGLVEAEPQGRSILYRADFAAMRGLVDYLTENCCGGDAAACAPQASAPAPARASRRHA
jgi:ArsR family transcriptional regulator, arsenate/arsenite/antimonite-responsive transcriptional repressor